MWLKRDAIAQSVILLCPAMPTCSQPTPSDISDLVSAKALLTARKLQARVTSNAVAAESQKDDPVPGEAASAARKPAAKTATTPKVVRFADGSKPGNLKSTPKAKAQKVKAEPIEQPAAKPQVPKGRAAANSTGVKELLTRKAAEKGKSAKAIREAFKRTYKVDPRTAVAKAGSRKQNSEDVAPAEVIEAMTKGLTSDDEDSWLKMWLENDCAWHRHTAVETYAVNDGTEASGDRTWLTEDQMLQVFRNNAVVIALKEEYSKCDKSNRAHPVVPECKAAHQYHCHVNESERKFLKKVLNKEVKSEADIDGEDAIQLRKKLKSSSYNEPAASNPPASAAASSPAASAASATPATAPASAAEPTDNAGEQTAEEHDKAAKLAKLQASRDTARKSPQVQKLRWLKGVVDLLQKCGSRISIAEQSCEHWPNNMGEHYKKDFAGSIVKLKAARTWLETARADRSVAKKLKELHQLVEAVKADIKSFDALRKTYGESRKSKGDDA